MSRRINYPDVRMYKSTQLKELLRAIDFTIIQIERVPTKKIRQGYIKDLKEQFQEIALRLD